MPRQNAKRKGACEQGKRAVRQQLISSRGVPSEQWVSFLSLCDWWNVDAKLLKGQVTVRKRTQRR